MGFDQAFDQWIYNGWKDLPPLPPLQIRTPNKAYAFAVHGVNGPVLTISDVGELWISPEAGAAEEAMTELYRWWKRMGVPVAVDPEIRLEV
jgi:hypothetical protein